MQQLAQSEQLPILPDEIIEKIFRIYPPAAMATNRRFNAIAAEAIAGISPPFHPKPYTCKCRPLDNTPKYNQPRILMQLYLYGTIYYVMGDLDFGASTSTPEQFARGAPPKYTSLIQDSATAEAMVPPECIGHEYWLVRNRRTVVCVTQQQVTVVRYNVAVSSAGNTYMASASLLDSRVYIVAALYRLTLEIFWASESGSPGVDCILVYLPGTPPELNITSSLIRYRESGAMFDIDIRRRSGPGNNECPCLTHLVSLRVDYHGLLELLCGAVGGDMSMHIDGKLVELAGLIRGGL